MADVRSPGTSTSSSAPHGLSSASNRPTTTITTPPPSAASAHLSSGKRGRSRPGTPDDVLGPPSKTSSSPSLRDLSSSSASNGCPFDLASSSTTASSAATAGRAAPQATAASGSAFVSDLPPFSATVTADPPQHKLLQQSATIGASAKSSAHLQQSTSPSRQQYSQYQQQQQQGSVIPQPLSHNSTATLLEQRVPQSSGGLGIGIVRPAGASAGTGAGPGQQAAHPSSGEDNNIASFSAAVGATSTSSSIAQTMNGQQQMHGNGSSSSYGASGGLSAGSSHYGSSSTDGTGTSGSSGGKSSHNTSLNSAPLTGLGVMTGSGASPSKLAAMHGQTYSAPPSGAGPMGASSLYAETSATSTVPSGYPVTTSAAPYGYISPGTGQPFLGGATGQTGTLHHASHQTMPAHLPQSTYGASSSAGPGMMPSFTSAGQAVLQTSSSAPHHGGVPAPTNPPNKHLFNTFPASSSTSHLPGMRGSIAGQSSTGSSWQSNNSLSPTGHRRSDDIEASFVSPQAFTPSTDAGSPAVGKMLQQTQYYQQPQAHPSSYQAVPVQQGAQQQPSWLLTSSASSAGDLAQGQGQALQPSSMLSSSPAAGGGQALAMHPAQGGPPAASTQSGYYSAPTPGTGVDYQAVVDEIMSQSRKGTDYGLDLGDFEMLDTLGTGTFGRVLLVRLAPRPNAQGQTVQLHPGMPHYFAMKVLAKTEVVRLKQVEHINCERSILGAVDHPGIVNLFCTFQDSLNIYMLLEFVQGGELFSHLRRAVRFSADVSRFYAANIILVLEYLHNRNLIYRDLKPENLLLDADGYLKVTDFGFAKYVPDRTFTLCGTPEYLAPEIIQSAGHGKAADWWAFGVLLFEMLCGYPPFFDDSAWGIYEKILAGNFTFPPHVDPVARDLVRRLLSSDRSKRLGNLRNGALDVRNHQWFEGVDWLAVERRIIPAPIIPRIRSHSDSQNFERYPSIPIESVPGLAKAKGYKIHEEADPYEHLFTNF